MTRYGPGNTQLDDRSIRRLRRPPWFRKTTVRLEANGPKGVAGKLNPALNILSGNVVDAESCADAAYMYLRRGHESIGITATALAFFGFVWAVGKHAEALRADDKKFLEWPFHNGRCGPGFLAESSIVRALLRTVFTEAAVAKIMLRVRDDGEPWVSEHVGDINNDKELQEAIDVSSAVHKPRPAHGVSFEVLFAPGGSSKAAIIDMGFQVWLKGIVDELPYEVAMAYHLFRAPHHFTVADAAARQERKAKAFQIGSKWVMGPINILLDPILAEARVPSKQAALRARIVEACNCGVEGDYRLKARHELGWILAAKGKCKPAPKDILALRTLAEWGAVDFDCPWILGKAKLVSKWPGLHAAVWAVPRMFPGEHQFVHERFVRVLDALRQGMLAVHVVPLVDTPNALAKARKAIRQSASESPSALLAYERVFPVKNKFNPPDVAPQCFSNGGVICVRDAELVNWTFLAAAVDARVTTVYLYGSTARAVYATGRRSGGAAWLRLLTNATFIFPDAITVHTDCLAATCYDPADPQFLQLSHRANAEMIAYANKPQILTAATLKDMQLKYIEPKGVVPWGSVIETLRRGVEDPDGQQPLKRIRYG